MRANTLIAVVLTLIVTTNAKSLDCGQCHFDHCPIHCEHRVPDPCGCCAEGICATIGGETCSANQPCPGEYYCDTSMGGGKCVCKLDQRMACGYDGITYPSICDLHLNSKAGLKKWGMCDTPPTIVGGPSDTTVILGEPIALDCEVKGFPVPSISWKFMGKNGEVKMLPGDDEMTAIQIRGGPEQMMATSWVQIVAARESDQGVYVCLANNIYGQAKAQALVLKHGASLN